MKKLCDACGTPIAGGVYIGRALLCPQCRVIVKARISSLRAAGSPVSAIGIARRIFRQENRTGVFTIRDFPLTLLDRARCRAISNGTSVRDLMLGLLVDYLDNA